MNEVFFRSFDQCMFETAFIWQLQEVFAGLCYDIKNDGIQEDINTDVGKAECSLTEFSRCLGLAAFFQVCFANQACLLCKVCGGPCV